MTGQHRLGSRVYQQQLRARRAAAGLCRLCTQPAKRGYRTCFRHLLYLARWKAAKRQRDREAA